MTTLINLVYEFKHYNLTLKSTANKFTKEKMGKRLIQDSFNMYNIMQDAHLYFPSFIICLCKNIANYLL